MVGRKSKSQRRHSRSRKQRGGDYGSYGNFAFTGPAGVSAGGVPFESRAADNAHCGWHGRVAPQLGGRRKSKSKQRGGSCGCNGLMQFGGGSGNGGFGFGLSNQLGKVYDHLSVGACPPTPHATQLGGASPLEISSYPAGYGFGPRGVVSTDSAHYLDPTGYDRTCRGGYRKTKGKGHRKGKGRKSHRKSHH
jgi:hypothetical protein